MYIYQCILYIYIYIYISGNQRKFRVERLSSDFLGRFAGNRCTPRGEGGRAGREGANQPRARASEIRAGSSAVALYSLRHSPPARTFKVENGPAGYYYRKSKIPGLQFRSHSLQRGFQNTDGARLAGTEREGKSGTSPAPPCRATRH